MECPLCSNDNTSLIMESMNCIKDEGINIYFKDGESPAWMQSNDQTFNAYIMPMRI